MFKDPIRHFVQAQMGRVDHQGVFGLAERVDLALEVLPVAGNHRLEDLVWLGFLAARAELPVAALRPLIDRRVEIYLIPSGSIVQGATAATVASRGASRREATPAPVTPVQAVPTQATPEAGEP